MAVLDGEIGLFIREASAYFTDEGDILFFSDAGEHKRSLRGVIDREWQIYEGGCRTEGDRQDSLDEAKKMARLFDDLAAHVRKLWGL